MIIRIYRYQNDSVKKFNAKMHHLSKGIIENYNVIINGKKIYEEPIDSDIKRNKEIKKINNRARWRLYYRLFVGL